MIEFTKAFVANGKTYATLVEAKKAELLVLFIDDDPGGYTGEEIVNRLIDSADKIVDILTTTATSKPRARSINGGKKNRRPKEIPPPVELPETPEAA